MSSTSRHLLVIALVFAIVFGSGLVTYAVWSALSGFDSLYTGVVALLLWVATFYLGGILFWRGLARVSSRPIQ